MQGNARRHIVIMRIMMRITAKSLNVIMRLTAKSLNNKFERSGRVAPLVHAADLYDAFANSLDWIVVHITCFIHLNSKFIFVYYKTRISHCTSLIQLF